MIIIKQKKLNTWAVCLVSIIFLILFAHYIHVQHSVGGEGFVYYLGYLSWLFLFCINLFKYKIERQWLYIYIILFFNEIIAMIFGEIYFSNALNDFHRIVFFIIAIYVSFNIKWKSYISHKDALFVLKFIIIFGFIVSIYTIINSKEIIYYILKGQDVSFYKWAYRGFFSNRNILAEFLLLCSISSWWVFFITNKKIYILYLALFFFQIYLTDSRSSLYAVIMLYLVAIYMKTRRKKFLLICFSLVIIYVGLSGDLINIFSQIIENSSNHITNQGIDSGVIRLQNWQLGIEKLIKSGTIITGFGSGSVNIFLVDFCGLAYGSFHNIYMDILFEGGIIKLTIYLYLLYCICKNSFSCKYKKIIIASFLAYCFHSCFESGAMLFSSNNNAVLATILFAIIPQGIENST